MTINVRLLARNLVRAALVPMIVGCVTSYASASIQTLALWTFEVSQPTTAGPHVAEGGSNAATSFALGFHQDAATVFSTPVGNGSAHSFSSNRWSAGDYYQFQTSTAGFENITFGWDQTRSGSGPGDFKLQVDYGSGFVDILPSYTVGTTSWSSSTLHSGSVFAPVSLSVSASNLALITVRLTSNATTATGGTNRVDNVIVSGTAIGTGVIPEASALLVWMVLCGTVLIGWKRRRELI